MAGHFPIAALTWLFGGATLAALLVVVYRLRRRPIVWMMTATDRRVAFHRDALTALDSAIAAARAEGRTAEAERLLPARAVHLRGLANLVAGREFAKG